MEYRQLGRSGLRVSTITLGTMGFGGTGWASSVGRIDVDGARRQIEMCRDAGVNLVDTADVYSEGLSEQILGEALGKDRDEVLVATKVRGDMGPGPNDGGLSRHHIVRACEASLRRLEHRPHRPLPGARVGRPDSARGDPRPRSTRSCARARCATSARRTTPRASS